MNLKCLKYNLLNLHERLKSFKMGWRDDSQLRIPSLVLSTHIL